MAALLHQAALQPPHPTPKPNPWTHASTPSLSLPQAAPSRRRRAPARRLQAAGSDRAIGTPATDGTSSSDTPTKAPSSKKTSRKEKQRQQQRLREREQQQEQMLRASLVEAAAAAGQEGGDGSDDELPQAVFDRILQRILFTVGVPMASGVALLNVYDALKRGRGVVVPPWVPLLTILVAFGTSALGIAYGTLSASWDPEKEGSLLGIDEARTNWPELWKEENEKDKDK